MTLNEMTSGSGNNLFYFAIIATLAGHFTYHFVSQAQQVREWLSARYADSRFWVRWIFFQKSVGFLFMGFLPAIFYILFYDGHITDFGLTYNHIITNWHFLLGLPALMVFISFFAARSKKQQEIYPQMRIKRWTKMQFFVNAVGWIIYLMAYEYLFRGLFLFAGVDLFGIWPAIFINVAVYSAVHMHKGIAETLGAVPFGIVACWLTLTTGTFLVSAFAHIGMAVSMEFFAIKFNKEMQFVKSGGQK
ncbi:MAG TPA: CPBP family intramembrane metalloprotease [Bacteroidales bacterium]|nr:CPBP family intramembrane metalloprotease [Bacteroidales bacterium]